MSDAWTWTFVDAAGAEVTGEPTSSFKAASTAR